MVHTQGNACGDGVDQSAARVLLVDDDPDIRHVVRLYLERTDALQVVGEAADGQEGIDRARQLQPDIVLLDVMMPGTSGHEAVPELLRVSPQSMIVMLSALAAGSNEEPALSAGAFAYIEKSSIDPQFGEQLRELLVRFRHALQGRTAWAPERPPTTVRGAYPRLPAG